MYRGVAFELAEAAESPAYFVLSVRKCGSSVLNVMAHALSASPGLPFINVTGTLFAAGLLPNAWRFDPEVAKLFDGGNVYGGFRDFPKVIADRPVFVNARKILLIRDPRDALVSEYFSNAYSHPIPEQGIARDEMLQQRAVARVRGIESSVLQRARGMRGTMLEFAQLLSDPLLRLFRYEEVITHKRELMEDICRHFDWPVYPKIIESILTKVDVFPDAERPTEFIRRVVPGDHREKLSAGAITQLNELLAEPLRLFGYAP
jgi:sulfotransferase family protein